MEGQHNQKVKIWYSQKDGPTWGGRDLSLGCRPLDLSRVRAPSLPQVSVCSPPAARVSGGLWGRLSPFRLRLQQSPSPQEACLENIPAQNRLRRGRPAPRARGRHNDGPAHTQIHTRRPLHTNTRAHAHSPAQSEPRGHCPDGRRAHPGPRPQAPARKQPQAPALGPTPSATSRHANTPPTPVGARLAQPPPPPPRRPHLAALRAPLGAAPSAPRPCSAPGPLRRDGPGPRRLRAASSRGHPRPGEGDECEPPRSAPCPDAPPNWARPQESPRPILDSTPCGEA
ncbi:uncharacterized protein LOC131395881 [Diceros bicornis minor]|uniref:uncharacterized protein LOC131395881 n=1 Tax=Diceros bicornis minor TaxID=77932 RepID=UPI0026EF5DF4|nr:uncharacterized protein LOC131395881 [Diceros bicornis minor]